MASFLDKNELSRTEGAEITVFRPPVPTRSVSNGKFTPMLQTEHQKQVEARIGQLADAYGARHGLDRRRSSKVDLRVEHLDAGDRLVVRLDYNMREPCVWLPVATPLRLVRLSGRQEEALVVEIPSSRPRRYRTHGRARSRLR